MTRHGPITRRPRIRRLPRAAAVVASAALLCGGASRPVDPPPTRPATTVDLGLAYQQFEEVLRRHSLPPEERGRVHRRFDIAAASFFGRDLGGAVRQINALTLERLVGPEVGPAHSLAAGIRLTFDPPIGIAGSTTMLRVRLQVLAGSEVAARGRWTYTLELSADRGRVLVREPVTLVAPPGAARWPDVVIELDSAAVGVATYEARLVCPDGVSLQVGQWVVMPEDPETWCRANDAMLSDLDDDLEPWGAVCRARNALLSRHEPGRRLTSWVLDKARLALEVRLEAQALRDGRNPYRMRTGDLWLPLPAQGGTVPCRIYVPRQATDGSLPLVIALHGAGGNEHVFMEANGSGRIRDLADEHGFIVLSPLVYPVAGNRAVLDELLGTVMQLWDVDRRRVYVIGHSMGGAAALALAIQSDVQMAAACSIAGPGSIPPGDRLPPTLVCAAALDTMVPASRIEAAAAAAIAQGQPVEYREVAETGHALVVSEVLPEAIAWLLAHDRGRRAPTDPDGAP